jgi:hypothetical protein
MISIIDHGKTLECYRENIYKKLHLHQKFHKAREHARFNNSLDFVISPIR